jgi:aryl-alcohol dehydrogenase-like predicted oxidoreductase
LATSRSKAVSSIAVGWGRLRQNVELGASGCGFGQYNVRRAEECPAKDHRQFDPRFQGENLEANRNAVEIVRNIADAIGAKPSQVALAWLLGKGDFIVPIPGTKRRDLEENAGAVDIKLSDDNVARLEAALRPEAVSGPRYNEKVMAWADR